MSIHVAKINLVKISNITNDIITSKTPYKEAINYHEDFRIIYDDSIPNSAGNPTLFDYLDNEYNDGYRFKQIDQYTIVTELRGSEGDNSEVEALLTSIDDKIILPSSLSDSTSNPTITSIGSFPHLYNGSTWDRYRNNLEITALSSSARTTTTQSSDLVNYNHKGAAIFIDVTAQSGGQINSIEIQAKINSSYFTIAQFSSLAITTTGQKAFLVYPGAAHLSSWTSNPLQSIIPRNWRIQITHGNANSITYSVIVSMIL